MKYDQNSLDVEKWLRIFRDNQQNRPEPNWSAPINLPPKGRRAIFQSLREFQLGDGGGPASLIAWNRDHWLDHQPQLRSVVNAWFKEEEGHARLLGQLLQRFGVPPLKGHWSFAAFCSLRRALGVQFELQILTLTELSSTAYYRWLRARCPDRAVKDVCTLILRDEAGHIAFQADRLRAKGAPWTGCKRWLWTAQFYFFGLGAASVLWLSHHPCLRSLGVSLIDFFSEAHRQFTRFLARLPLSAQPFSKKTSLATATTEAE